MVTSPLAHVDRCLGQKKQVICSKVREGGTGSGFARAKLFLMLELETPE